jgi:hypothetical protein
LFLDLDSLNGIVSQHTYKGFSFSANFPPDEIEFKIPLPVLRSKITPSREAKSKNKYKVF